MGQVKKVKKNGKVILRDGGGVVVGKWFDLKIVPKLFGERKGVNYIFLAA